MILDSTSNSGNIRLGASGGPSSNALGQAKAGVYMDGTGDFLISDGNTPGGTSVSESYVRFDASSQEFELQTASLKFKADGNIESQDFLIERTRLFGAGQDHTGTFKLKEDFCDGSSTTFASADDSFAFLAREDDDATEVQLERDAFFTNLIIANGHTLKTNGFRLYVRGTLTINSTGKIDCSGTAGSNGQSQGGGSGGNAGGTGDDLDLGTSRTPTLEPGSPGKTGGKGGPTSGTADITGAGGGGSGGSGGIIFIAAKTIVNNGSTNGYGIVATGGTGGHGAAGGQILV
tara:strand:- start:417 stop:1286 length:870 start_codon:yes stop_codon:yes gene_type:complete